MHTDGALRGAKLLLVAVIFFIADGTGWKQPPRPIPVRPGLRSQSPRFLQTRLGHVHLVPEVGVLKDRDQLAFFDEVALVHQPLFDAAVYLGPDPREDLGRNSPGALDLRQHLLLQDRRDADFTRG